MRMDVEEHAATGDYTYALTIRRADLVRAKFDQKDRALFDDVRASASIADALLALETVARRVEQAWETYFTSAGAPDV